MNKESNAPIQSRPTFTQWSKREILLLPSRIHNVKHKKILAAIFVLLGYALFISFTQPVVPIDRTSSISPYEQYSLAMQITIGVLLAVFFWYLQLSENDKIREISLRRKYFWANEAIRELHAIMSACSLIRNKYQEALGNASQNETIGEPTINQTVDYIKVCLTRLNVALTQIADLLTDPSIYRDVTKDNYQDLTRLLEDAHIIETQKCYQSIPLYGERIMLIQSFIDRIESEKPKHPPPPLMKTRTKGEAVEIRENVVAVKNANGTETPIK